jgi:hypothetical protein
MSPRITRRWRNIQGQGGSSGGRAVIPRFAAPVGCRREPVRRGGVGEGVDLPGPARRRRRPGVAGRGALQRWERLPPGQGPLRPDVYTLSPPAIARGPDSSAEPDGMTARSHHRWLRPAPARAICRMNGLIIARIGPRCRSGSIRGGSGRRHRSTQHNAGFRDQSRACVAIREQLSWRGLGEGLPASRRCERTDERLAAGASGKWSRASPTTTPTAGREAGSRRICTWSSIRASSRSRSLSRRAGPTSRGRRGRLWRGLRLRKPGRSLPLAIHTRARM